MSKVVTENEVRRLSRGDTLYAGERALVTPLAAETARMLGIEIVLTPPPHSSPPPVDGEAAQKLCINLPDRDGATYVVKVSGGKVTILEETDGRLAVRDCADKRICRHNR